MPSPRRYTALITATLLLTGCSSTAGDAHTGTPMSMTPGQSMPGMAAESSTTATQPAGKPSTTALMICRGDVPEDITNVLALTAPAKGTATFADGLYTCTYHLPMGTMILSVKDSPSKPAAATYFQQLRPALGATQDSPGLGEKAYATDKGNVVVLKDNMTLTVDTTGLPVIFGPQKQKRTDLAYEIASIILGCWVEHG